MADGRFGATFYQSVGPDVFTEIVSPLAYNDGEWHHAAAVLRNGLVGLYVDGTLVAQDSTDPITSVRPSTRINIGHVASDFGGDIGAEVSCARVECRSRLAPNPSPTTADGRFGATFYQSIGPDVFTEIVSPLAYNDGAWHHAAAVLRNGLVVIYVDGAIKASDATGPISSVRSSTSVQIGHVASDFGGDIDEVLVYPRALSDAEIAALVGGPTSSVQYLGAKLPFLASPSFTPSSWSPPPNVSLTVATFPSSQNSSRVVTAIAESDCSVSRKKGSSLPVDAANCHGPKTWINPTGAFSQK